METSSDTTPDSPKDIENKKDEPKASDAEKNNSEKKKPSAGVALCLTSCKLNRVTITAGEPPSEQCSKELIPYFQSIIGKKRNILHFTFYELFYNI